MRYLSICLALLTLTACGNREPVSSDGAAGSTPADAAATAPVTPTGVHVSPELQRKWGVTVGVPERTTAEAAVTLAGVLRLNEQHTVQVTSLLEGKIVSLGAELGALVKPGQVLATLHAPALAQAKTSFLQAATRAELATREYDRGRTLLQQEAIDQKELLRRKTEADNAVTEAGVAESHLHSFGLDQAAVDGLLRRARQPAAGDHQDDLADPYLAITAPIAGRVIERDVIVGQHIEPERLLFTVADLATLWAVLDAREGDLPYLAPNKPVRIRSTVYPARVWVGRIIHVGDIVDEKSRTVKVRVATPNDGLLLKPNMFIHGEIADTVTSRSVLTVPADAVQSVNGEAVVFVRTMLDRFVARPVEAGDRTGSRRVILRGLEGSEFIALTGAFNLKAELLKSSLAGE
jgi:cobalt-zinc-cadmium efflux system membrane fusion protein